MSSNPKMLKLLTLLNVSAVKPAPRTTPTALPAAGDGDEAAKHKQKKKRKRGMLYAYSDSSEDEAFGSPKTLKKKKSLTWGGEIGPSGSSFSDEGSSSNGGTPTRKVIPAPQVLVKNNNGSASKLSVVVSANDGDDEDNEPAASITIESTESIKTAKNGSALIVETKDEDPFNTNFSPVLPASFVSSIKALSAESTDGATLQWTSNKIKVNGMGKVVSLSAPGQSADEEVLTAAPHIHPKLISSVSTSSLSLLPTLSTYKDIYCPLSAASSKASSSLSSDEKLRQRESAIEAEKEQRREDCTLHWVNHVLKTRRKILKNNDAIAHAAASATATQPTEVRDQGFTRPKVLILLPFRSAALNWMASLVKLVGEPEDKKKAKKGGKDEVDEGLNLQVENKSRFLEEFSLPDGTVDRLLASPSLWPADHISTFSGNIDDNFRVGLKFTRKSLKLFSGFYSSDVIFASPLGLRVSIEKEKSSDFLSSIEIVIADQLDVMSMQNWEHVQFIFSKLNAIPDDAHGCDFSRVKPWYLDGHSKYLRQTILFSSYETPEMRSLFNKSLTNVAGKLRAETRNNGELARVRKGVKQTFTRFSSLDPAGEPDVRFDYFKTKGLPSLMKSAVSSSETIIVVPSYFDYIRVVGHMRKQNGLNFVAISEYSSNQEISRARTSFFKKSKAIMVITERFYFYRRYRLRGYKTLYFYQLPEHSQFYPELVSFPFFKGKTGDEMDDEVDEGQVSVKALYSKWDLMRLERIVGSDDAKRMITDGGEESFTFI